MKSDLYAIFPICLFFFSCKPELPVKEITQKKYKLNLPIGPVTITEYTIDSCQYLGYLEGISHENYLTHKGNCTNTIHTH